MRTAPRPAAQKHSACNFKPAPAPVGRIVGAHQRRCTVVVRAEQQTQAEPKGAPGRKKVVSIGESLFDLIADQKGLPRDKVKSWTPYAGGAPANVATALAKLGLDVVLVTALGRDAPGDNLYALFNECNVKLTGIQRRDEPTRDIYVVRDNAGDREFAGFGQPSELYCDAHLDAAMLPYQDIKEAAVVVTGTLGLAYPGSREALRAAVKAAKEGGAKVMVDVNWRPVFWKDFEEAKKEILDYLQLADIIKLSDADLKALLDFNPDTALINPCAVLEKFPNASGLLATAGGDGAAYCFHSSTKGDHSGFVPVFKLEVVDTTGAGDAFTAGFVYKLIEAGSLEALSSDPLKLKEAVVFAAASGGLTTTKKGGISGQPKLEEVMKAFEASKSWYNFW